MWLVSKYQECLTYALELIGVDTKNVNIKLISTIIPYITITPIDALLYKKWILTMGKYKTIAGTIYYPSIGSLVFSIPTMYYYHRGKINPKIPINPVIAISVLDVIGSLITVFTVPYISVMLNMIISKIAMPLMMIGSYIFFAKRYVWSHYLGAFLTVFGISIMAVPKLMSPSKSSNPTAVIFFALSFIPWTGANIVKEAYLKKVKMNKYFMNFLLFVVQLCIAIPVFPIIYYTMKESSLSITQYISNSLSCQFGASGDSECNYSLLILIIYQTFSGLSSVWGFIIIQESSAVVYMILSTLRIPITQCMGYYLSYYGVMEFTKEDNFEATWLNIISMVVIMTGSILYTINKEQVSDDKYIDVISTNNINTEFTKADEIEISEWDRLHAELDNENDLCNAQNKLPQFVSNKSETIGLLNKPQPQYQQIE